MIGGGSRGQAERQTCGMAGFLHGQSGARARSVDPKGWMVVQPYARVRPGFHSLFSIIAANQLQRVSGPERSGYQSRSELWILLIDFRHPLGALSARREDHIT